MPLHLSFLDDPIDRLSQNGLSSGDIIELVGPSCSGKTEILRHLALTAILPADITLDSTHLPLFGSNRPVVLIDIDRRFNLPRLKHCIEAYVRRRCLDSDITATHTINAFIHTVVTESLRNIIVIRPALPLTRLSLAACLYSIPSETADAAYIFVDSLPDTFPWDLYHTTLKTVGAVGVVTCKSPSKSTRASFRFLLGRKETLTCRLLTPASNEGEVQWDILEDGIA